MARGRKKTPTVLKEMQGTARADRLVENEMTADLVLQLPEPPELLSEIDLGKISVNKAYQLVRDKYILTDEPQKQEDTLEDDLLNVLDKHKPKNKDVMKILSKYYQN